MSRSVAVVQNSLIDSAALDELIRAAIFFGDSVLIRASYSTPRLPSSERGFIERKVRELEELGVLRYWAHEYEVGDSEGTRLPDGSTKRAHVVLERRSLRSALDELDDRVQASREEAYVAGATQKQLRQGAAEIVDLREQLTALVIASELGQDGIVSPGRGKQILDRGLRDGGLKSFNDLAIRRVLATLNIGPLWRLNAQQIDAARSCSVAFKKLLEEKVKAVAAIRSDVTSEAVADEFVAEYREALRKLPMTPEQDALRGDIAWDMVTTIIPSALLLKFGIKFFQWRKDSASVKPFLMLSSMQARTADPESRIK